MNNTGHILCLRQIEMAVKLLVQRPSTIFRIVGFPSIHPGCTNTTPINTSTQSILLCARPAKTHRRRHAPDLGRVILDRPQIKIENKRTPKIKDPQGTQRKGQNFFPDGPPSGLPCPPLSANNEGAFGIQYWRRKLCERLLAIAHPRIGFFSDRRRCLAAFSFSQFVPQFEKPLAAGSGDRTVKLQKKGNEKVTWERLPLRDLKNWGSNAAVQ
ncbi:hypothetical protein C8R44DRAFT_755103 [Mycena epipterygia]|nr:hypothetical protein C8R44DRAFT_755103 [Mycena epipterygia]